MKLFEIQEILEAEIIFGENQLEKTIFGAGSADLMDDVLSSVAKDAVLLTGLTTEHVIKLAQSCNMPMFLTRFSLFIASGRLYMNGLRGLNGSW